MKIKVSLVEVHNNKEFLLDESEDAVFVVNCPQKIHLKRKGYPKDEYIVDITE